MIKNSYSVWIPNLQHTPFRKSPLWLRTYNNQAHLTYQSNQFPNHTAMTLASIDLCHRGTWTGGKCHLDLHPKRKAPFGRRPIIVYDTKHAASGEHDCCNRAKECIICKQHKIHTKHFLLRLSKAMAECA